MVLSYINAHALNLAGTTPWFKEFLNASDIAYPDGEGVRFGSWLLGNSLPPQTALTRWIWELAEFSCRQGFSLYFLGGEQHVVEGAVSALSAKSPGLHCAGFHHGYFQKHGPESDTVVEEINNAKPNILLVGFGMPVQEDWIRRNKGRLNVNVILTAGSSFDYAAGTKSVCPSWVSRFGLEWFYRFLVEPKRLFRRYFFGNPRFLLHVILQRMRNGKTQHISGAN